MVPVHHTGMTRTCRRTAPLPALSRTLLATWLSAAACWPIVGLCASAASDMPPLAARSIGLPDLGDGTEISPAAERRLGDSIVRSLYRDPDYIDDAILSDYVQSLWQPLLRAARARRPAARTGRDLRLANTLIPRTCHQCFRTTGWLFRPVPGYGGNRTNPR